MWNSFAVSGYSFSIYFIASLFLDYHIDTLNVEASLLGEEILNCLSSKEPLVIDDEFKSRQDEIKKYCGINGGNNSYIGINITLAEGEYLLLEENKELKESLYLYETPYIETSVKNSRAPGKYTKETNITVLTEEEEKLVLNLEILIANEV